MQESQLSLGLKSQWSPLVLSWLSMHPSKRIIILLDIDSPEQLPTNIILFCPIISENKIQFLDDQISQYFAQLLGDQLANIALGVPILFAPLLIILNH